MPWLTVPQSWQTLYVGVEQTQNIVLQKRRKNTPARWVLFCAVLAT